MPTTILVNGHEATLKNFRWSVPKNPDLEAALDCLLSPNGPREGDPNPDLTAAVEVARILGAEILGATPPVVGATVPVAESRSDRAPARSADRDPVASTGGTPRAPAPGRHFGTPPRQAAPNADSEAEGGARNVAMDLARGRLETNESTYPILDGWIIAAHSERRLTERHGQAPLVERRKPGTKPRAGSWWVVRGHLTVRATEGTEQLSVPPSRVFFLAQGIRFEVLSLQPVYQNTRMHSFVYSQSKARKWNFVALCQPTNGQLSLLLKAPAAGQGPLGRP